MLMPHAGLALIGMTVRDLSSEVSAMELLQMYNVILDATSCEAECTPTPQPR